MNVITIESQAFMKIMDDLEAIRANLNQKSAQNPLSEKWLDIQETCQLLKVSKRTLQNYRDNGVLPYSQIAGKIYFKASDIQTHLENHYTKPQRPKK